MILVRRFPFQSKMILQKSQHTELARALSRNQNRLIRALYSAVTDECCATWQNAPPFDKLQGWAHSQLSTAVDILRERYNSRDSLFLELLAGWIHSRLVTGLAEGGQPADYRPDVAVKFCRTAWLNILRAHVSDGALQLLNTDLDSVASMLPGPSIKKASVLFIGDCLQFEVMTSLLGPCVRAQIEVKPTLVNERLPHLMKSRILSYRPNEFDLVFFSPFSHTFSSEYETLIKPRSSLWRTEKLAASVTSILKDVEWILDTLTNHFDCPVYVHNTSGTASLFGRVRGPVKNITSWRARAITRRMINQAVSRLVLDGRRPTLKLLDENALRLTSGDGQLGKVYLNSHAFHPTRLGVELGRGPYFHTIYANTFLVGKKVLVCDLDNTLWEGVIGEGPVRHFVDRQKIIKALRQRGVLLSINSKNDARNVIWSGSELQLDDFVAPQINWESKSANIARIRDALNLRVKDFIFVDDRPDELDRVRNAFPDITAMDATRPDTWAFLSCWCNKLNPDPEEDRTSLYHEREKRGQFVDALLTKEQQAEGEASALAALHLSVRIQRTIGSGHKRAAELINRTNQFNLCGSRATERELANLGHRVNAVIEAQAADKFGSMGVVGIMQVIWRADDIEIPIFVLSCRAFGFGIEHAMLASLKTLGPPDCTVIGHYKQTPLNDICKNFYPSSGMHWDGSRWVALLRDLPPPPPWLSVETSLESAVLVRP